MITAYTGLPGSGKSTFLAKKTLQLLRYNLKIYKKYGFKRYIYSNIKIDHDIELKHKNQIKYFSTVEELPLFEDADVVIDELSLYFDAQNWADTPTDVKKFLRLHRHYNIDIFGVAQDFDTVDISFRRLVRQLYLLRRIRGTKEPVPYKVLKRPWVFGLKHMVDPSTFEEKKEDYKFLHTEFYFLTRSDFSIFDTHEKFDLSPTIHFKHLVKICPQPGCDFKKVIHR